MADTKPSTNGRSPYEELAKGEIRLLTILSADEESAVCELRVYPLAQAPLYNAVSYCWGDEIDMTTITCNGANLRIRKTLFEAFPYFSLHGPEPSRPLWVDAICLNQENDDEKALQVPLMGDFYKSAARCIVWLGVGDLRTDAAIVWIRFFLYGWNHQLDSRAALKQAKLQPYWDSVRRFLMLPWFRRLWVLQETILPPHITLLCGSRLLEWSTLVAFDNIVLGVHSHRIMDPAQRINMLEDQGPLFVIRFLELFRSISKQGFSLGRIMFATERRLCKEPVDRVWAIMGLLPASTRRQIQAAGITDYSHSGRRDYWLSYVAVMAQLFVVDPVGFWFAIAGSQGLRKNPSMPSWCPDWNAPRLYNALRMKKLHAGFPHQTLTPETVGSLPASSICLIPDSNSLFVTGHHIDTIQRVSMLPPFSDGYIGHPDITTQMAKFQEHLRWLEECAEIAREALRPSSTFLNALCRTIVAFDGQAEMEYPED